MGLLAGKIVRGCVAEGRRSKRKKGRGGSERKREREKGLTRTQ